MAGQQTKLQDDVRFRILRLLEKNPEMSQRDLAQAVGISTGRVHYVLKWLVDKGLVKLDNFTTSEDKRRSAYVLTPKGITTRIEMTRDFVARKVIEYELLRAEIEQLSGLVDQDHIQQSVSSQGIGEAEDTPNRESSGNATRRQGRDSE